MKSEKEQSFDQISRFIFGRNFSFTFYDTDLSDILIDELSMYPVEKDSTTVRIDVCSDISVQPDNKEKVLLGAIDTRLAKTKFYGADNELESVHFVLKKPLNKIHSFIQRCMSLGYNDRIGRIGQILHEQVLVPATFFLDDLAPVHGSCMKIEGKTVIFGGAGGVGKTSLELEFCFNRPGAFLSDDMVILDSEQLAYPNLNYPKIYAYNVSGYENLEKIILSNRSFGDKAHWNVRTLFDLSKARRRCSPSQLFSAIVSSPEKVSHYIILSRAEVEGINISEMKKELAVDRTVDILISEFRHLFKNHQTSEYFSLDKMVKKWELILKEAFKEIKCVEVSIPVNLDHNKFREELPEAILKVLKN